LFGRRLAVRNATRFPYTTLFRSEREQVVRIVSRRRRLCQRSLAGGADADIHMAVPAGIGMAVEGFDVDVIIGSGGAGDEGRLRQVSKSHLVDRSHVENPSVDDRM